MKKRMLSATPSNLMPFAPNYSALSYNNANFLEFDACNVEQLAEEFGTPLYVYSTGSILKAIEALKSALAGRRSLVCYSVKASSNLSLLNLINKNGCGMDIVSGGELHRALKAGVAAEQIVFSGVGKSEEEIRAALQQNILLFGVESQEELHLIEAIAQSSGCRARVSLRINPNVDAGTHPYISTGRRQDKFGLSLEQARAIWRQADHFSAVDICGIGFHIGSQLTKLTAFRRTARSIAKLIRELKGQGITLRYIQVGGGLGINYNREKPPSVVEYAALLCENLPFEDSTLIFEPGRYIVGNAAILITRLLYQKDHFRKNIYVVDAAMNDLLRPALYGAYHNILPARRTEDAFVKADLVGPICESGDFLARNRKMPPFSRGDYLVLCSVGAYGFVMSSNYNSRPRAAEVLIDSQAKARLIRKRESYAELTRLEEFSL